MMCVVHRSTGQGGIEDSRYFVTYLRMFYFVLSAGFNVEKVEYKNVAFTVWDVGGQDKLRPLWRQYLSNSDGLVFSVSTSPVFYTAIRVDASC